MMLHMVAGRLAEDCEVKEVIKDDGTVETVVNNTVYVWDGIKKHESIPIKIEAWNDVAEELAKYKKGEIIQFVGRVICVMRTPKDSDKEFATMAYRIMKIDENKLAFKEFNRLMHEFIKPNIR